MKQDTETFDLTLADVKAFLRRYALFIAAVFFGTVLGSYTVLSMVSDRYEASAQLLIKLGHENLDPPATARGNVYSPGLRREEINSEIHILASLEVANAVVESFGPEFFREKDEVPSSVAGQIKYHIKRTVRATRQNLDGVLIALGLRKAVSPHDALVGGLLKSLQAEQIKESDVISVRLRMADPNVAQAILDRWIRTYYARRSRVRANASVKEFLDTETGRYKQSLHAADDRIQKWKRDQSITSAPEQKTLLLQQASALRNEQAQTERDIRAAHEQISSTKGLLGNISSTQQTRRQETPNPQLETLRTRLTSLTIERTRLLSKYKEDSEVVRATDEEIAHTRELITKESSAQTTLVEYDVNPSHRQLQQTLQEQQVRLAGLEARAKLQSAQVAALDEQLTATDEAGARLDQLERERKVIEQAFTNVASRKAEADISAQLDQSHVSNVSLLAAPVASEEPVYPKRLLLMGISCLLGVLIGAGLALLIEYFSDDVRSGERLQKLTGLRWLGTAEAESTAVG